jgi:hypothetical protein
MLMYEMICNYFRYTLGVVFTYVDSAYLLLSAVNVQYLSTTDVSSLKVVILFDKTSVQLASSRCRPRTL